MENIVSALDGQGEKRFPDDLPAGKSGRRASCFADIAAPKTGTMK
jgi:hypothetical protein